MRHGTSNRRQRSRSNGGRRNNQPKTQVFDSNGPDVRIRGTAHQVMEKYIALARDSTAAGNRVLAESYFQHAEHYQRIINAWKKDVQSVHSGAADSDKKRKEPPSGKVGAKDDLSLPSSILGEKSEALPEAASGARTEELSAV